MCKPAVFVLLLAFLAFGCSSSERQAEIDIGDGVVVGRLLPNGVEAYLGIPYAEPPVGHRRWKPPTEMSFPTSEKMVAAEFGPACPQDQGNPEWYRTIAEHFGSSPSVVSDLTDISEDCLFLNIWTPADRKPGPLPVMVWIHGGSNVNGWAHEPNYLGHHLAARGVVVVSLNYRLGPLGFLAHPTINGGGETQRATNVGLLDQIAALSWISEHVHLFGGDPQNVTVFGESAGGADIYALMRSPLAEGLFHRAAIQSGALAKPAIVGREDAEQAGRALLAQYTDEDLSVLQEIPWQDLIENRSKLIPDYYFAPIFDSKELPSKISTRRIPLLIGVNRDEWFMYLPDDSDGLLAESLEQYTSGHLTQVETYLSAEQRGVKHKTNLLLSAAEFLCPAIEIAKANAESGAPTYVYFFTRERPGAEGLHAYHGAEIPYVFGTSDAWLPQSNQDEALSDAMMTYWLNFARYGDPNSDQSPTWPKFSSDQRRMLELGRSIEVLSSNPAAVCEYLDG
ncbi:MAG: carboxylesterase family protein [Pseudomonadota bacterium]